MTVDDHLRRADELLEQGSAEIEAALPDVPEYSVGACRFLKAELAVVRRRLENLRKVLGTRRTG